MESRDWVDDILDSRKGNTASFERIVEAFKGMAIGYAFSILRDFHDAEDASQEAFIYAYTHLPQLKNPKAFPGWFRSIVFKYCDRIRRKQRAVTIPFIEEEIPAPRGNRPESGLGEEIVDSMSSLTEKEREAAVLFYINGYSISEIGGFLQAGESAVKSRLFTARKKLKSRMETMIRRTLGKNVPGDGFNKRVTAILGGVRAFKESMKSGEHCSFVSALRTVLLYMKEDVSYAHLMAVSGSAFSFHWEQKGWVNGEFYPGKPLLGRNDLRVIEQAFDAVGYDFSLVGNKDYGKTDEIPACPAMESGDRIRESIISSLRDGKMPVMAIGMAGDENTCIITGYESDEDLVIGTGIFETDHGDDPGFELDAGGFFRKRNWLKDTACIILPGKKRKLDEDAVNRRILERAIVSMRGDDGESGLNGLDAWIAAVEDDAELSGSNPDAVRKHLEYHASKLPEVAEGGWYGAMFLSGLANRKPFMAPALFSAASALARVHVLVWDCWKIAGGFWRNPEEDAPLFKDAARRGEISAILRRIKTLQEEALGSLQKALDDYDLSHRSYMEAD